MGVLETAVMATWTAAGVILAHYAAMVSSDNGALGNVMSPGGNPVGLQLGALIEVKF